MSKLVKFHSVLTTELFISCLWLTLATPLWAVYCFSLRLWFLMHYFCLLSSIFVLNLFVWCNISLLPGMFFLVIWTWLIFFYRHYTEKNWISIFHLVYSKFLHVLIGVVFQCVYKYSCFYLASPLHNFLQRKLLFLKSLIFVWLNIL